MRTPLTTRRRGTALVITVGLLAVLAVIAFGFAVLARLHHDLSRAYRASAQTDLIAMAAVQYALSEIRYGYPNVVAGQPATYRNYQVGVASSAITSPACPWYVDPTIAAKGYQVPGSTSYRYCNSRCNSYALVNDDLGDRIAVSLVKVLDSAGKLNINDRYDSGDDSTSDPNGRLQSLLAAVLEKIGYTSADASTLSKSILIARNALSPKRFTSLQQLRTKVTGMTARSFELLKHYVTIYSWPHEVPVDTTNGFPFVVSVDPAAANPPFVRSNSTVSPPDKVRSPININTAPRELLYALLNAIQLNDGTPRLTTEADKLAKWIARKRAPLNTDYWDNGTQTANWTTWISPVTSATNGYFWSLQQCFSTGNRFDGWSNYPLGPFDSWNEVVDFLYSFTSSFADDAGGDPFSASTVGDTAGLSLSTKQAEIILAGTCPKTFATDRVGYNSYHLGYARFKKDPSATPTTSREMYLRDWDVTAGTAIPQALGKSRLAANGETHPFCFSAMGRFELYNSTYTFLKADSGTVTAVANDTELTDSTKTWSTSPVQWRGYSVLIYKGKGKGQIRGILYNTANTLFVDRWSRPFDGSVPLDSTTDPAVANSTRSCYYILGPGAMLDRLDVDPVTKAPANRVAVSPTVSGLATNAATVVDTTALWEDDQWNGHRIVFYRGSLAVGGGPNGEDIETVVTSSIQERVIVGTNKAARQTITTPGGIEPAQSLIVAPDIDTTTLVGGTYTGYIILGSDGLVPHAAAIKAYDVIHHTTQDDFERNQSAADCLRVATGPYNGAATDITAADASKYDGWIASKKKEATAGSGLVHNFKVKTLEPDSGGAWVASNPIKADLVKDPMKYATGIFTSEGIHLKDPAHYVDYRLASGTFITSARTEGGYVSFWFRPDEGFFTGDHPIVTIYGENATEEKITLQVTTVTGNRTLQLSVTSKQRNYEGTFTDGNHRPTLASAPVVRYKGGVSTYTDATYGNISTWQAGEWHHIAFAWYESANDGESHNSDAGYNSDANINTDWRDDDASVPGPPVRPDYLLDPEVACRLRIWTDGKSLPVDTTVAGANNKPAFNFFPRTAEATEASVRLEGAATGTLDGLLVSRHTDPLLAVKPDDFQVALGPRYDWGTGSEHGYYTSNVIPIPNPGKDKLTLGTVSWTGFMPWTKDTERWYVAGKPPVYAHVTLGATTSRDVPNPTDTTGSWPVFGGGGPLVNTTDGKPVEDATGTTTVNLQYKIFLLPYCGEDAGAAQVGRLKGRQTPVVGDVTITYLGPIVFYYWQ